MEKGDKCKCEGEKEQGCRKQRRSYDQLIGCQLQVLGFGRPTTTGALASTSVHTAAVTATINALSGSSTPWSAHRPLTTFLLGLDEDLDVASTLGLDPDAALTTLSQRKRSSDSTFGRLELLKLEKGASLVTDDLKFFDGPEAYGDCVP